MDVACAACGGDSDRSKTCKRCGGLKVELLTACPWKHTPGEIWETIQLVNMTETALPVAGGWLDQTAAFGEAYRLVKSEQATCKAAVSGGL